MHEAVFVGTSSAVVQSVEGVSTMVTVALVRGNFVIAL